MDEQTIDLKQVIKTIRKRKRTIIQTFLATVIIVAAISFLLPPTYEGEATLRIKQPKGLADSLLGDTPLGNTGATKQQMSTYAEILKSRTVVQSVIDQTMAGKEDIPTYEDMLKHITTQPVKDTEILNIKVKADSPEEARNITNTLVNTFIERLTGLVRSEQSTVREFIGERMRDAKADLAKAEDNLERYKKNEKIVAPEDETKAMIDKLSALDKLSAENAVAMTANQARLVSARKELADENPGFVADNPLIQQYKGKLAELEVQLATLSETYTEDYPQVTEVRAAISEVRAKLNAEIQRVVTANAPSMNPVHQAILQGRIQAEAEMNAAGAQKNAITTILAKSEEQLSTLPAKEKGLIQVQRDSDVAQDIYIMLAKRYEEAKISEVMQPTDVQIIDEAIVPDKPVSPKKALNIIIAAVLGLFLGIGLALMLEYLNQAIRSTDDVEYYLDLAVLGSIPDYNKFDSEAKSTGILEKIKRVFNRRARQ